MEEQDQEHQVHYAGTQQTEQDKFHESQSFDNQDSYGWPFQNPFEGQDQEHQINDKFDKTQSIDNQASYGWRPNQDNPQEQQSQTLDLNQQTQGFDLEQTQTFDNQNVFEQTINHDKSKAFQPEDLSQQTQGFWDHFENEFSNNHGSPSNRNIESNNPQPITQKPKNTGSVNSLWGKLGDLDEDIVPSSVNTFETQNTDFAQSSNSHSFWGKLDDLGGDVAPPSVDTQQTQNNDFSQAQGSYQNWHQESLFNFETSSKVAEIDNQHTNDHHLDDFESWALTNERKNNTAPFSNTLNHKVEVLDEKSTTENIFLVTGLSTDGKMISSTTEKTLNEDKIRTFDFGRGDIGPEDDSLVYLSKSTTEKTLFKDDSFSHKYTTENDDSKQSKTPNEKDDKGHFLITQQVTNEHTSPEPFNSNKYDLQNNKPSDKPYNQVADVELPEEIEQQFETQNVQQVNQFHDEQKYDYFEQNKFQHQSSDLEQQNTQFENFGGEKPENREQLFLSHKQTNGDFADQQFVDFSQMNQQWHSEQQNIQQQFPDDFYQQNQYPQLQNSHTSDIEQHNADSNLADFGQQNVKSEFEILPENGQEEKTIKKDYVEDIGQQPNKNDILEKGVSTTPATVTEKPGFWKSIGNKFVNAKNKVASWFS